LKSMSALQFQVSCTDKISTACSKKFDLIFVLDAYSSTCGTKACPDWGHSLQFVKNVVSSFNIGPADTRVAVVTDANQAKLVISFDK